ncbi:CoA-binding protein [Leadbetterella sp. DM7]|uniref:CoA-binding protein n=1 Tax=Leadbetterella sp. DM7 TaxID=3235085 RepID=UPI00349E5BA2
MKKTLIIGASPNPSRYAYLAAERLLNHGIAIELLGRRKGEVSGQPIKTLPSEISRDIHTVTLYLSEQNQKEYEDFILSLKPVRVIFNPGAENPAFAARLSENGIEAVEGCTLVMLSTGQYNL